MKMAAIRGYGGAVDIGDVAEDKCVESVLAP